MKITVRLFAGARELTGMEAIMLKCRAGATVAELRGTIAEQYPQLAPLLSHCRFAANSNYVDETYRLVEGEEIACIPPVSGG